MSMRQPAAQRMTPARSEADRAAAERRDAGVRRTGLILASIALVFFFGVIVAQWLHTPAASFAVLGTAIMLYLAIAIGRHLRK